MTKLGKERNKAKEVILSQTENKRWKQEKTNPEKKKQTSRTQDTYLNLSVKKTEKHNQQQTQHTNAQNTVSSYAENAQ